MTTQDTLTATEPIRVCFNPGCGSVLEYHQQYCSYGCRDGVDLVGSDEDEGEESDTEVEAMADEGGVLDSAEKIKKIIAEFLRSLHLEDGVRTEAFARGDVDLKAELAEFLHLRTSRDAHEDKLKDRTVTGMAIVIGRHLKKLARRVLARSGKGSDTEEAPAPQHPWDENAAIHKRAVVLVDDDDEREEEEEEEEEEDLMTEEEWKVILAREAAKFVRGFPITSAERAKELLAGEIDTYHELLEYLNGSKYVIDRRDSGTILRIADAQLTKRAKYFLASIEGGESSTRKKAAGVTGSKRKRGSPEAPSVKGEVEDEPPAKRRKTG